MAPKIRLAVQKSRDPNKSSGLSSFRGLSSHRGPSSNRAGQPLAGSHRASSKSADTATRRTRLRPTKVPEEDGEEETRSDNDILPQSPHASAWAMAPPEVQRSFLQSLLDVSRLPSDAESQQQRRREALRRKALERASEVGTSF